MSGICGVIDLTRQGRAEAAQAQRMSDVLRHRGPDGEGFYESPNIVLGARRLGVIDLQAQQPFYDEEREIVLVYDGAIYNYRELRDTLKRRNHIFGTESDGETLVHLYQEYGLGLFSHLRGMYAFALWDVKTERLTLAVDHLSMKPLYLHQQDGILRFASEVKALLADVDTLGRVNLTALDTYLRFGYVSGAETLFDGITRLPPGHAYVIEKGSEGRLEAFYSYSHPPRLRQPSPSHKEGEKRRDGMVIQEARELLADAARLHLRSDAPLGIALDGGLESAVVLALTAQEARGTLQTFAAGHDRDGAGLARARQLAVHFGAAHHERIFTVQEWWQGLQAAIYHLDEPISSPAAIHSLLLAESAAGRVKVLLSSRGGGALFGGYPAHHAIPQLVAGRRPQPSAFAPLQNMLGVSEPPQDTGLIRVGAISPKETATRLKPLVEAVLSDELRQSLYKPELKQASEQSRIFAAIVERSWRDDPYDTAQALVIHTWLSGNALLALDKVTMATSLQARLPFLDTTLLKFAAGLPSEIRLRASHHILGEAARPLLPAFALESVEASEAWLVGWLENDLGGEIRQVLLDPNGFITEFFERAALETLLKDHFWGRRRQHELVFRLLALELWGRRFG